MRFISLQGWFAQVLHKQIVLIKSVQKASILDLILGKVSLQKFRIYTADSISRIRSFGDEARENGVGLLNSYFLFNALNQLKLSLFHQIFFIWYSGVFLAVWELDIFVAC